MKKQKLGGGADVERLHKQCLAALKAIQRKKEAIYFLEPVDWKALDLPTYPKLIKKPMDLGTVEQKLQESPCGYKTVTDFIADVKLVWSNAQLFNLEGSEVYSFAASCSEAFEAKMADVDHGPLREGASKSSCSRDSLSGDALAACRKVVSELKKNKNAELFLEPVDWKGLGLLDYPAVIKKPMDLGTITKNMESGKYSTVLDVLSDINLVWSNAMTYNADGSFVYVAAADMKSEANKKLAPIVAAAGGSIKDDPGPRGGVSGGTSAGAAKAPARSSGGNGNNSSRNSLSGDSLAACRKVVSELKKNKNAELFLEPVDWKGLGLLDYPAVIKKPMDLGTITKNMESGKYSTVLDVLSDINLVWSNAMTYNADGSFVYVAAADLKAITEQKMAPHIAAARGAADGPKEVTFEMRRQLTEHVAHLSPKELYGLLGVVEEVCGRAVDTKSPSNVEIDLDALGLQAFLRVDKYVNECLGRAKKKPKY